MRLSVSVISTLHLLLGTKGVFSAPTAPLEAREPAVANYGELIEKCQVDGTFALTYDDGPSAITPQLLDVLAEAEAKATFFISGTRWDRVAIDQDAEWIDMIKRIDREGHQLASHTWSHPDLDNSTSSTRREEMIRMQSAMQDILGKHPTYMRAPYVHCVTEACLADMKDLGYRVVVWETDSEDWKDPKNLTAMKKAFDTAFDTTQETSMLFIQHDHIPVSAIDLTKYVLGRLPERGWRPVTVAECLGDSDGAYATTSTVE